MTITTSLALTLGTFVLPFALPLKQRIAAEMGLCSVDHDPKTGKLPANLTARTYTLGPQRAFAFADTGLHFNTAPKGASPQFSERDHNAAYQRVSALTYALGAGLIGLACLSDSIPLALTLPLLGAAGIVVLPNLDARIRENQS